MAQKKEIGIGIGAIVLIGAGLWALSKAKPAAVVPPAVAPPVSIYPPIIPLPPTEPLPAKITSSEIPAISLDVWRGLTGEQIKTLPVTKETGTVGVETYYKISTPVAIGDTGFKIWGMTETGSTVVSTKPPETYAAWEWMR